MSREAKWILPQILGLFFFDWLLMTFVEDDALVYKGLALLWLISVSGIVITGLYLFRTEPPARRVGNAKPRD